MTRVTYGVASSSFRSIRSSSQCENFETTPKEGKKALQRDFYVDDILTGASSASKAKELQLGLISTLTQAQFDLRKWTSSDTDLVLSLPPKYIEAKENFKFLDEEHTINTLETIWNPLSDKFRFTISKSKSLKAESITKRQMLTDIAQTFDTLGWITPVIISLKSLMQKTWIAKLDGDQKLPVDLSQEYVDWREKLSCI